MGVAAAEVVGGAVLTGTALYYANLQKKDGDQAVNQPDQENPKQDMVAEATEIADKAETSDLINAVTAGVNFYNAYQHNNIAGVINAAYPQNNLNKLLLIK